MALLFRCPKFAPSEPLGILGAVMFGRRDWTRTNDPNHVKVML